MVLGIFIFGYEGRPEMPAVGESGEIKGAYTLDGIMRLDKPYRCTFEKSDNTSRVKGVIHTDGQSAFGEFRIKTDLEKNEFNSFLLIKNKEAYIWTSLQNVGFKTYVAKSAIRGASLEEQTQIVGTRDQIEYECKLWEDSGTFAFEAPSWITFVDLKK